MGFLVLSLLSLCTLVAGFSTYQNGFYPSCNLPLCQPNYGGACESYTCCNPDQECLRHASSCSLTGPGVSYRCVQRGASSTETYYYSYAPYQPDEIFTVCGRYAEEHYDPYSQTYEEAYAEGSIFRVCPSYTPEQPCY